MAVHLVEQSVRPMVAHSAVWWAASMERQLVACWVVHWAGKMVETRVAN